MKKVLLLCVSTLVLLNGCKKGDTTNKSTTAVYLLSKYTDSQSNELATYQYDNKNRVIDITISNPGTPGANVQETKFTYDDNDRVTEGDIYLNGQAYEKDIYTYTTGLVNVQTASANNSKGSYQLTLNSNQRVTMSTYGSTYNTYNYDNAGNMASTAYYDITQSSSPSTTKTYTFDNKNSPFLNVKGNYNLLNIQPEYANNTLSFHVITTTAPTANFTYTYTYTYNADGYPTSRTAVISGTGSGTSTETFTYIKQ